MPCNLATNVVRPLSLSPRTTSDFVAGAFFVDDLTSRNIDALFRLIIVQLVEQKLIYLPNTLLFFSIIYRWKRFIDGSLLRHTIYAMSIVKINKKEGKAKILSNISVMVAEKERK